MTGTGKADNGHCSACGHALPDKVTTKCARCGVAVGDPLEQAIDELKKYDEGCEPRSHKEYDEEG